MRKPVARLAAVLALGVSPLTAASAAWQHEAPVSVTSLTPANRAAARYRPS